MDKIRLNTYNTGINNLEGHGMKKARASIQAPQFILLLLLLPIIASGCEATPAPSPTPPNTETLYKSEVSSEDCWLCGTGSEDSLAGVYWRQDNIAIVSLNTFEITPLEINNYDFLTGNLIEEVSGTVSFGGGSTGNDGFSVTMLIDSDRGYATGQLNFNEDKALDIEKASTFLCEECLNKVLPKDTNTCFGVGALNLKTKELKLFSENLAGFGLGDFYIDCNLQVQSSKHQNQPQLDLLIFYCPIRYENIT